MEQAARWHSSADSLSVAVNISAGSLVDDELPDLVADLLATFGLPAAKLTLEITEESLRPTTPSLAELRQHGCDQAQGFHIARPMPAVELELWLETRREHHPTKVGLGR